MKSHYIIEYKIRALINMDTEINRNMLIGHIAGLTEYRKTQLPDMLKNKNR